MSNPVKQYIEKRAKANQINNAALGVVVAVDGTGRHTVELDGGRQLMVFSATGTTYATGDVVSIRYLSSDKRQAEIAGKTTRRAATTTLVVYR